MKIQEQFTVAAPATEVWSFLTDPERVATALPGAEISERIDDNTWSGGMSVKVGPVSAAYRGTVAFDLDEAAHTAVVRAKGQGRAGMGNADMTMTSRIDALAPSETEVTVEADLRVTGILAQLGRGMMQHVSKKMFREFTQAMEKELATATPD